VVLELKRDRTPREIVAQALDYASWVKDLSYEQIEIITKDFTGKPLAQVFNEHYGFSIPQTVNSNHSMVILASELDDSSERIVQYLADQYGVPINVGVRWPDGLASVTPMSTSSRGRSLETKTIFFGK
jgi:hypothetical protein